MVTMVVVVVVVAIVNARRIPIAAQLIQHVTKQHVYRLNWLSTIVRSNHS